MIEVQQHGQSIIPAYTAPAGWHEVPTRQFFALAEWEQGKGTVAQQLEIITGVPAATWLQAPTQEVDAHLAMLEWTLTQVDWSALKPPQQIEIDGKAYPVPATLKNEPFAVTVSLNAALDTVATTQETGMEVAWQIPFAVALVFEHKVSGLPVDEDRAKDFTEKILNLPAAVVLPIGFFFLTITAEQRRLGLMRLDTLRASTKRGQG